LIEFTASRHNLWRPVRERPASQLALPLCGSTTAPRIALPTLCDR